MILVSRKYRNPRFDTDDITDLVVQDLSGLLPDAQVIPAWRSHVKLKAVDALTKVDSVALSVEVTRGCGEILYDPDCPESKGWAEKLGEKFGLKLREGWYLGDKRRGLDFHLKAPAPAVILEIDSLSV